MTFKVKYIDFHWDNYQGGSGKSVEINLTVHLDGPVTDAWELIHKQVDQHTQESRPFRQNNKYTIIGAQLV